MAGSFEKEDGTVVWWSGRRLERMLWTRSPTIAILAWLPIAFVATIDVCTRRDPVHDDPRQSTIESSFFTTSKVRTDLPE